jgi:hypothetical protein
MLNKISQTQKDKYHMFSLICGTRNEKDMKVEGRLLKYEAHWEGRIREGVQGEYDQDT